MDQKTLEMLECVYDERFKDATYPYPLGGYDEVMEEACVRTSKGEGARVLDVWAGEGNLAAHFVAARAETSCVASDEQQASRLRERFKGFARVSVMCAGSQGHLAQAFEAGPEAIRGALGSRHTECAGGFDAVVCGGGLWAPDMDSYVACVEGIFELFLPGRKGVLCWADTSFGDEASRARHENAKSLYFPAWRDALVPRKFKVTYSQLAPCMGLYKIKRR